MAITIIQTPPELTFGLTTASLMPVYNTIAYKVLSDNIAECNFKYRADIYVNGNFVKTLKLYPNVGGEAEFKINAVLQDYIANLPEINVLGFTSDTNRLLEYTVHFGEEYDTSINCDQPVVIYPDLTNTTTQYAWNGAMQYREWFDYISNTDTYYMEPITPGKFLTHQPDRILIGMGEQAELSYIVLPTTDYNASQLVIETYGTTQSMLSLDYISNPIGSVVDYTNMFQTVGVGPENLNNLLGYPLIDNSVDYYRVYLLSSASSELILNPTFSYMSGPGGGPTQNKWNTATYSGCSTTFGISVGNKLQFTMPDVSCGDTLTIQYLGGTFSEGLSYTITIHVDTVNNPSGEAQYIQPRLGGNAGTAFGGVGTFSTTIVAGPTGILELIGYFDADTGGFGSHAFSADNISVTLNGNVRTSEYKEYKIDRRKTRYSPKRFRWLNRLGGFDSYAFSQNEVNNISINRTEYDKLMPTYYNLGDRGRMNTSVNATQRTLSTSNWLTELENFWLEELYTSPNVYVQDVNPVYTFWQITPLSVNTVLYLSCPLTQAQQDAINTKSIFVDKCDNNINYDLEGIFTADVLDSTRIRLFIDPSGTTSTDCGIIYLSGVTLPQLPIIITSNGFDVKVKNRVRNINQTIEFEYAFNKNIQRN